MSARLWFARDTGFTADPKVQALGDEYGPGGPLALEELMAIAKLGGNCGSFEVGYSTLARRAFVTARKARHIVDAARLSGLIELTGEDGKTAIGCFPKWSRWQPKDPTGAERKARLRERKRNGDVT